MQCYYESCSKDSLSLLERRHLRMFHRGVLPVKQKPQKVIGFILPFHHPSYHFRLCWPGSPGEWGINPRTERGSNKLVSLNTVQCGHHTSCLFSALSSHQRHSCTSQNETKVTANTESNYDWCCSFTKQNPFFILFLWNRHHNIDFDNSSLLLIRSDPHLGECFSVNTLTLSWDGSTRFMNRAIVSRCESSPLQTWHVNLYETSYS